MKAIFLFALLLTTFISQASPFAKPNEDHGILKFHQSHPSKDIFPVEIYELDGQQITTRKNGLWLKPGTHTIKVSSVINRDQLNHSVSTRLIKNNSFVDKSLTISVEEGSVYYVGYDASDRNPNQWKPVVWKVKEL